MPALAELEVFHSRPIAPTRRLALGERDGTIELEGGTNAERQLRALSAIAKPAAARPRPTAAAPS